MPGPQGERGLPGERGLRGPAPEHEWIETSLRFRQRDETWGPLVDLKGPPGDPGEIREIPIYSGAGQSFVTQGGGGGGGGGGGEPCDCVQIVEELPSDLAPDTLYIQVCLGPTGDGFTFWFLDPCAGAS
ncbi:MAG: hypothetical protein ACU843_15470, partial [Gammaproteobacteria bacterium]